MKGTMFILDRSGHTSVEWDTETSDGPLDPAYAEREFDRLVKQGYLGFGTTEAGKSEQLKTLDRAAAETYPKVTVTPPFAGG